MSLVDRVGRKHWTEEQIQKYVGHYRKVYFTYAADEALRQRSASGGSVTAILTHLLQSGQIDGALVLRSIVMDGRVECEFFIARSPEELLSAQGSKYMAVYFGRDAIPQILKFPGQLAVVALPCDASLLHRIRRKEPEVDRKVRLVVALVCGHNSERDLTDHVTRKVGKGHGRLTYFHYRSGHWRGHLTAEYEDGTRVVKPFGCFSDYRNVYMFAQRKCHHCFDHYGYHCDISAGDIWSLSMRKHPIKQTALISRTEVGEAAIQSATKAGILTAGEEDVREVLDGQSRTMPFHYNVSARSQAGKFFRMYIKDRVKEKVRWNDYAVAWIALFNERYSRTEWGRHIMLALPRPILRLYVYFLKALELL